MFFGMVSSDSIRCWGLFAGWTFVTVEWIFPSFSFFGGWFVFSFWPPFWWSARKLSTFFTSSFAKFCKEERRERKSWLVSLAQSPHLYDVDRDASPAGLESGAVLLRAQPHPLHKGQEFWCMTFIASTLVETFLASLLVLICIAVSRLDIGGIFEFWVCEVFFTVFREKSS